MNHHDRFAKVTGVLAGLPDPDVISLYTWGTEADYHGTAALPALLARFGRTPRLTETSKSVQARWTEDGIDVVVAAWIGAEADELRAALAEPTDAELDARAATHPSVTGDLPAPSDEVWDRIARDLWVGGRPPRVIDLRDGKGEVA